MKKEILSVNEYAKRVKEAQALSVIKSAKSAKDELKSKAKKEALEKVNKSLSEAKKELAANKKALAAERKALSQAKKEADQSIVKASERKISSLENKIKNNELRINTLGKRISEAKGKLAEAQALAKKSADESKAAKQALAQAEKELEKAKKASGLFADELREDESKALAQDELAKKELEQAQKEAQAQREALAQAQAKREAARLLLAQSRARRGKASEEDLLLIWQATSAEHTKEACERVDEFIKKLFKDSKELREALKAANLAHKSPSQACKLVQDNWDLWAKVYDLSGIKVGKRENFNPSLFSAKKLHPYLLAASAEGLKIGSLSLSGSCKPLVNFDPLVIFKLLLWDKYLKAENISQDEQALHLEILLKLSEALKAKKEADQLSAEAKKEAQAAREAFALAQDASKPCTISEFLKLAEASKKAKEREREARLNKRRAQREARKAQSLAQAQAQEAQRERKAASSQAQAESKEALRAANG